jgi:hypothetical protein
MSLMIRRLTALVASLPVIAGGSLVAHSLAHRLVGSAGADQHTHDYLSRAPTVLAIAFGFSLAALAVALRTAEGHLRAPAWLFALAPPVGFAVQEHLERALQGDSTARTALEATFALGVALQLPFALLAYVAARILFRAVASVVTRLAPRRMRLRVPPLARPVYRVSLPRPALAGSCSGRGPPALSS